MNRVREDRYVKWRAGVLGFLVLMGLWSAMCSFVDGLRVRELPNVMGLHYEDAAAVLTDRGFQVTAVPADPGSILPCSPWNRSVKAGSVFAVNGERDPNCPGTPTRDRSVLLYYAAADYVYEPGTEQPEPPPLMTSPFPAEPKAPPGWTALFCVKFRTEDMILLQSSIPHFVPLKFRSNSVSHIKHGKSPLDPSHDSQGKKSSSSPLRSSETPKRLNICQGQGETGQAYSLGRQFPL